MSTKKCHNCSTQLIGSFCHNCGQRGVVHKVTFKETFQDIIAAIFSVDAPFIRTLQLLILNPGKLFREYLAGKRKTYYKPVSFFIIATIIYILIRSLLAYDPLTAAGVKVGGQSLEAAAKYMVRNINNIMFLFVFTLALFLKLFFYKRNTLAEFVALAFYALGMYALIGACTLFYLKYVENASKLVYVLLFMLYVIYAFTSYFQSKRKIVTIVKISIVYVLAFACYTGLGYLCSFLVIWLRQ